MDPAEGHAVENTRNIDISDFIDNSKIGAFQVGLFTLCAMGLIIDGFNVQALGFVGPAVIEEMGLDTRQLATFWPRQTLASCLARSCSRSWAMRGGAARCCSGRSSSLAS